jgi:hypothetical protein
MKTLSVEPTPLAQFHRLVSEAELFSNQHLDETSESYLVFLLMRFSNRQQLGSRPIALEYLEGINRVGSDRQSHLQDVADQCLILTGFFPEQAAQRLVSVGYFINIGRSAYLELAETTTRAVSALFRKIADEFVMLMDILHTIRLQDPAKIFDPLLAMDIVQHSGGIQAQKVLQGYTHSTPMFIAQEAHRVH